MPRNAPTNNNDPAQNGGDDNLSRDERIAQAAMADKRYPAAAFAYVAKAVPAVAKELCAREKNRSARKHISGQELTEGLRRLLLRDFGRMAIDVLKSWHITRTLDFGEIVYDLVAVNVLSVSPQDSREDFVDVYDFDEAFTKSIIPRGPVKPLPIL